MAGPAAANEMSDHGPNEIKLFRTCFIALIATAFGFVIRGQVLTDWGTQFGLDETKKGALGGVGLWPFAISIVLFSLVVDKIGYGKALAFAFLCHISSAIVTISAKTYEMLWWGTFLSALGNGTVEAVINPVVATMFPRSKTKWLNILHAGWPGGLVLGGILGLLLTGLGYTDWRIKVGLIFIPTIAYGIMMIGKKFPVHERVAAGISYIDMLKEGGVLAALIVIALMVREIAIDVVPMSLAVQIGLIAAITIAYGAYVRSLGRPMFIFLVLVMIPLATTELGTDGWITDLMTPVMKGNAGWVLVYTSFIMMVMRFFAGSIVHRISPLGLLALSAAIACFGLVSLSMATGIGIIFAATLYAFGKTFFWPTTLGVVSEQFPKGGALTINLIAGVGMLGVGIVGNIYIGNVQDRIVNTHLEKENPALHAKVTGEKQSVLGDYISVDAKKLETATTAEKEEIKKFQDASKQKALLWIAALPAFMFVCYLILIAYFKAKGGYKAEVLVGHAAKDAKFTGGTEGPAEG